MMWKLLTWILIALLFVFGREEFAVLKESDEMRIAYLKEHNCQVEGYAGRSATPYYRCDNGLTRWEDIK